MASTELDDFLQLLRSGNLLSDAGIERIGVFGSLARGEQANDIDILVEDEIFDPHKLIRFRDQLARLTQKKIDLVLTKFANPIILHRARKDLIYVTRNKK